MFISAYFQTEGDFRFRHDKFSYQNPRKVIKLWAQKEMRNLKRMRQAGLSCPLPVLLREHILVMTFIGQDGIGAPHLSVSYAFYVTRVCQILTIYIGYFCALRTMEEYLP